MTLVAYDWMAFEIPIHNVNSSSSYELTSKTLALAKTPLIEFFH